MACTENQTNFFSEPLGDVANRSGQKELMQTVRLVPSSAFRNFLATEAAGGILLMAAATLAMIMANGPLYTTYHAVFHSPIGPVLTEKLGPLSAYLWINNALMAVFLLLVGLEIKSSSSMEN